ncbi:MAG TPA: glycosyltransferase [Longimicrobiales bacterium]|nr:glycosyltransferase [Longimicrobiales bacterium]
MMRVAFCIDNMNIGGTELNAVRTARRLVARGVDLRVFSLVAEGPLLAEYAALGVPVTCLPPGRLYGRRALSAGLTLMRIVRRERVEIVHAHDFYSNVFAAPWTRAAGAAFIASRRWWEGSEQRVKRWANRGAYALASRVLANSPAVARLLVRREGVPPRKVVVVPNFLDDAAFEEPPDSWRDNERRAFDIPSDAVLIGTVGSLSPIKDHATLLRAAAQLIPHFPALHVVLVGRDAGSGAALDRLAAELGITRRVRFAGQRPQHPSAHYLFDVSVLTSVSEGLPNSILEAMAAGRPVVATDVGAVSDAVIDHVTGFTVPPRDVGILTARLATLLEDPDLRCRLGSAGRLRARQMYSEDTAIGELIKVYGGLTGAEN